MIADKKLDFKIQGNIKESKICLVFLHGWMGNKNSFSAISDSFKIDNSVCIFPQAPYKLNNDNNKFSWTYEKSPGVFEKNEPLKLLLNFFENHIFNNFSSGDVYLFGFSQGGLVCYELLKNIDKSLGGVFPISGFIARIDNFKESKQKLLEKGTVWLHPSQKETPIIIGHGRSDDVISIEQSKLAYELLSKESDNIQLELFNGGHKINFSYIKKVKKFIERKYK